MRHVVNEMENIGVHSTDVRWESCTARGKGHLVRRQHSCHETKEDFVSQDKR